MNTIAQTLPSAESGAEPRRFPPSRTSRYLAGGHRHVQGWLTPLSARVIAFLLAYLASRRDERAFAIDVFDLQEFNVDGSGKGDRERFLANVERHAGSTDGLVVVTADSLKLRPDDLLTKAGPARFISVDGGHTEECTLNDLRLAEACLVSGGIVVLDDYFNQNWPDVSVGAARHFFSPAAKTKPFLVTPNKVFFAEERYHGVYHNAVRARFASNFTRSGRMFGSTVDVYLVEGARALGSAVSSLLTDEARLRLARYPRLKEFAKKAARR